MSGAPAPQNDAPNNTENNLPATQSESTIDYGEILARQENALAQQGQLITSLRGELGKRDQTWNKVKEALTGEPQQRLTPAQERQQRMRGLVAKVKEDAQESLRAGLSGMPHTVKVTEELAEYVSAADERADRLEAELRKAIERLDRQQNPAFAAMERAGFIMEGMVDESLVALYGDGPETEKVRGAQYDAITALINQEIKDLIASKKPEDKAALLKIQRNPKVMRSMVNHFAAQVIPPKVRAAMDQERLENEPDTAEGLISALAEAKQEYEKASEAGDAKRADFYSNLITKIRRDFLAFQQYGKKNQSGGQSINSLVQNFIGGSPRHG